MLQAANPMFKFELHRLSLRARDIGMPFARCSLREHAQSIASHALLWVRTEESGQLKRGGEHFGWFRRGHKRIDKAEAFSFLR